jgi:prolyl-tRNA synthetase
MRWSQAFIPTLREDPKDAEAISHKLMLRAGLVRRLGSGAYSYLPLAVRSLHRITRIVREEMTAAGAQECLLPALQPMELWKTTGRDVLLGDVLLRVTDRTGKQIALGPTHEEVITTLVSEIKSHRQLPLTLYQIQTKFRDEPRPRFGVIRSKEFLMKDAYSFDVTAEGLDATYQRMFAAYQRIFARCGVTALPCEADTGVMGGKVSHEFMAPSENGEDLVVRCTACGYAANREAAACSPGSGSSSTEPPKPIEEVQTPGAHTVDQVSAFFKTTPDRLIKTLIYESDQGAVAVLVRGDHEVNEPKLMRALGTPRLKLAGAGTIERLTGAPVGFAGPMKLTGARIIADHAVMRLVNGIAGANKADTHLANVTPGRDFTPAQVADVRMATPEDPCPRCGGRLEFLKAIEVGHVFKLGTKYSEALGAKVQDEAGQQVAMIMGCYGIGINRIMATVIEQRHDAAGVVWPAAIAPFDVVVSLLDPDNAEFAGLAEQVAQELTAAGREVLIDDRAQSPGSKLKDADLIGIPVQVVVGKTWEREQRLEVVERVSKTKQLIEREQVAAVVDKLLDKV